MKSPRKPKASKSRNLSKGHPRTGPDDFVSVARRLECDEDKGRFEKKLGKIEKAKPSDMKRGC
jgi:hypothetical protein